VRKITTNQRRKIIPHTTTACKTCNIFNAMFQADLRQALGNVFVADKEVRNVMLN